MNDTAVLVRLVEIRMWLDLIELLVLVGIAVMLAVMLKEVHKGRH